MPAYSAQDRAYVDEIFRAPTTFPAVRDEQVRQILRRRIHALEKIHTFKSFHADMVLLEACYKPLRKLWPKGNGSLRHICRKSFQGGDEDFEPKYADLWLYVVQNIRRLDAQGWDDSDDERKPGHSSPPLTREKAAMKRLALAAESRGLVPQRLPTWTKLRIDREDETKGELVAVSSRDFYTVDLRHRCGRPTESQFRHYQGRLSFDNVFGHGSGMRREGVSPSVVASTFVRSLLSYRFELGVQSEECAMPSSVWSSDPSPSQHEHRTSRVSQASRVEHEPHTSHRPSPDCGRGSPRGTTLPPDTSTCTNECSLHRVRTVDSEGALRSERSETLASRCDSTSTAADSDSWSHPYSCNELVDPACPSDATTTKARPGRSRDALHRQQKKRGKEDNGRAAAAQFRVSKRRSIRGGTLRQLGLVKKHFPESYGT